MRINLDILGYFVQRNRLNAARIYFYILNNHNNHFHKSDFQETLINLGISKRSLTRGLNQLQQLKICTQITHDYYRVHSWKKFLKQRCKTSIKIDLRSLRDIKQLRSVYYIGCYKKAYKLINWNRKKKQDRSHHWIKPKHQLSHVSSGYLPVSASLACSFSKAAQTNSTILKHLKRGTQSDLVSSMHQNIVHYYSEDLNDVLDYYNQVRYEPEILLMSSSFHFSVDISLDSPFFKNILCNLRVSKFQNKYFLISNFPNLISFNYSKFINTCKSVSYKKVNITKSCKPVSYTKFNFKNPQKEKIFDGVIY